ncbi:transmembrane protein C1orf162 homolog [Onychomys torridus]|uniref:transmembrane protein C1orf162 homolog n=1 Tax=Onychomys torridus TaxID=38674 RepID=UPI00167FD4EE|nr:transmembrane protein C1orf162 homolog [Onychomys torridus]
MGSSSSTSKPKTSTVTTAAPVTSSVPASCFFDPTKEHLILAFFAGVLLTLLLVTLIFVVVKSCRKSYSRAQAQDLVSEPPIKLSSVSKESLTYASMTFKPSEENSTDLTGDHSAGLDSTVYSQIKVAGSHLPLQ